MKRRFVQDPVTHELVEVSADFVPDVRAQDSVLWNDRIFQDGNDPRFTSRAQHREYMKRNGVTTVDDYRNHFARTQEEQRRYLAGEQRGKYREAIGRAIHQLENQRARK